MLSLFQLARTGNVDKFQESLNSRDGQSQLNSTDQFGFTPLHWAAQKGEERMVELLLRAGVDPNLQDGEGQTALHWAIDKAHAGVVRLLIEAGAALDVQDKFKHTALHRATALGQGKVVAQLLQHGADPNLQNHKGWTALHVACYYHRKGIVISLLESCNPTRMDVNLANKDGWQALHVLSMQGFTELAFVLVRNGANLNYASKDGNTPLHLACKAERASTIRLLMNVGANPNLRNAKGKRPIDLLTNDDLKPLVKAAPSEGQQSVAFGPGLKEGLEGRESRLIIVTPQKMVQERTLRPSAFSLELRWLRPLAEDEEDEPEALEEEDEALTVKGSVEQPPYEADAKFGSMLANYTAPRPGVYRLEIAYQGKPLQLSPWEVNIKAVKTDASRCVATGEGLQGGKVGQPNTFTIEARDTDGVPRMRGGDHFMVRLKLIQALTSEELGATAEENKDSSSPVTHRRKKGGGGEDSGSHSTRKHRAKGTSSKPHHHHNKGKKKKKKPRTDVTINDRKDGTYSVQYKVAKAGLFRITVRLGKRKTGEMIAGSPFMVAVGTEEQRAAMLARAKAGADSDLALSEHSSSEWKSASSAFDGSETDSGTLIPVSRQQRSSSSSSSRNPLAFILPSASSSGSVKIVPSPREQEEEEEPPAEALSSRRGTASERGGKGEEVAALRQEAERLKQENSSLQQQKLEAQEQNMKLQQELLRKEHELLQLKEQQLLQSPSTNRRATAHQEEGTSPASEQDLVVVVVERLKKDLRKERQKQQCGICGKAPRKMLLFPCLHFLYCEVCVSRMDACMSCGSKVTGYSNVREW